MRGARKKGLDIDVNIETDTNEEGRKEASGREEMEKKNK